MERVVADALVMNQAAPEVIPALPRPDPNAGLCGGGSEAGRGEGQVGAMLAALKLKLTSLEDVLPPAPLPSPPTAWRGQAGG